MNKKRLFGFLICFGLILSGCGNGESTTETTEEVVEETTEEDTMEETTVVSNSFDSYSGETSGTISVSTDINLFDDDVEPDDVEYDSDFVLITTAEMIEDMSQFTERDLSHEWESRPESMVQYITLDSEETDVSSVSGVFMEESYDGTVVLKIRMEGIYVFSGTLKDGQILVSCGDEERVQIVLDDVSIKNDGECILVENGEKCFITLEGKSTNSLTSTRGNDAVYSESIISIGGNGTLSVTAAGNGIVAGTVKMTGGTVDITAEENGISAENSFRIVAGTLSIGAQDDGIHVSGNDAGDGYVYIENGDITVSAVDDAIFAETAVLIEDGSFVSYSYEGIEADSVDINGGEIWIYTIGDGFNVNYNEESNVIRFDSDTIAETVEAMSDDELSSFADTYNLTDAELSEWTSSPSMDIFYSVSDYIPWNNNAVANEEDSPIGNEEEAEIEDTGNSSQTEDSSETENDITSSDENEEKTDTGSYIRISGGDIYINSNGDVFDCSGYVYIDGGISYVDGSKFKNNYIFNAYTAKFSGGIFSGVSLSENITNIETYKTNVISQSFLYEVEGGTEYIVEDEYGNNIISSTPEKNYQHFIVSSPNLVSGYYTISAGEQEVDTSITED